MPLAFSYLRYSSAEQAKGDSVRRQAEARDRWLTAHPAVTLDTSLVLADHGRSAYSRDDFDTYALAEFVRCCESGRVKRGDYLLVENLDRLSREHEVKACHLLTGILLRGVRVVQLEPQELVLDDRSDGFAVMRAVMELSRAHQESVRKSGIIGAAWRQKKKRAAEEVLTRRLPVWVRYDEDTGRLVLDEDKAAVVRRLFALALEGLGVLAIAKRLIAEGVPVLGRTTFKGKPVEWGSTQVHHILTNQATYGVYQPGKGSRGRGKKSVPDGKPVEGYYPAVIDRDTFYAVQKAIACRANAGRGRPPKGRVHLFGGLLRDALTQSGLTYKDGKTLVPVAARHSGTPWSAFPARVFEECVVGRLKELKPADVFGEGGGKADALAGELAEVEKLLATWKAKMDNPDIADLVSEKLAELNVRRKALKQQEEQARREEASPASRSWKQFRSLAGLLKRDGSDDTRRKVREALRRSLESAWVLVVAQGDYRLCAVQLFFQGGSRRDYLILHRITFGRQRPVRPRTWSLADVARPGDLDLRQPDHARRLEKFLLGIDLSGLTE
jgi:DNA invertase Pin-like site-specific DNA recombinase